MTNENPLLMNMLNMAQFIQMAQQHPTTSSSDVNALSQLSDSGLDFSLLFNEKSTSRPQKRKLGAEFRRSLEGYGFELVSQFVEDIQKEKIDYIPDDKITELRQQFLEINRDSVPLEAIQAFAENLRKAVDLVPDENLKNNGNDEEMDEAVSPPESKRQKCESNKSSAPSTPHPTPTDLNQQLMATMMGLPMMSGGSNSNPLMSPEMFQAAFASMLPSSMSMQNDSNNDMSPQKRARTRITDDQLKILRQYFDINNSPTEQQVKEMSRKAQLPEKVIKHWFRNTLFKERQRDKNSPYNFSVPAMTRIDVDAYEKTGEAKILPLKEEENDSKKETTPFEDTFTSAAQKLPSSSLIDSDQIIDQSNDNRATSPSNSSTHSSSAPLNMANASDIMANFNKAMAAAAAFPMFNNNGNDFASANPFAAFFGAASNTQNDDNNAFAQLLNGFSNVQTPSNPTTPGPKSAAAGSAPSSVGMSGGGSSRRANRTRFTDLQLRTLQEFFDRQAYPKDDDLEVLSKKLGLSPRVIVVWFQNARQKARKIYENQPNQDNDRFIRTPGCNFQCKRCQLVFQRYYELIQHQQKVCYMNDQDAQKNDNKSLEDHLDEEERNQVQKEGNKSDDDANSSEQGSGHVSTAPLSADNNNTTHSFLKLLKDVQSNGDVLMKMFKTQQQSNPITKFSKRCPFCSTLFSTAEKLTDHFASAHPDNPLVSSIDINALPDEEEQSCLTSTEELLGKISALTGASPLDLSAFAGNGNNESDFVQNDRPTSTPHSHQSNNEDNGQDNLDDYSSTGSFDLRALSTSPHTILSAFGSPLSALNGLGSGSSLSFGSAGHLQRSPAPGSGNKRYRTHLTPLQVFVMKSLFSDYKTPSMTECDVLGREISLNKRVVQVWFQNARAKQRKTGPGSIVSIEEGLCTTTSTGCDFCKIEFNGRITVQDHIFTTQHINQVKQNGSSIRGNGEESVENRPSRNNASRQRSSADDEQTITTEDMPLDPLNFMFGTLLDPNVVGTPITMLQIPEIVMTQISSSLQAGRTSTKFTQDGLEFGELANKVGDEDFRCAKQTESEVGWACPQCSNVFQQESFLKNHQKFICTGCDGVFRLVQKHYECLPCNSKFGTQDDFKEHCEQANHKSKRLMRLPPQLFPVLSNAASSNASC